MPNINPLVPWLHQKLDRITTEFLGKKEPDIVFDTAFQASYLVYWECLAVSNGYTDFWATAAKSLTLSNKSRPEIVEDLQEFTARWVKPLKGPQEPDSSDEESLSLFELLSGVE